MAKSQVAMLLKKELARVDELRLTDPGRAEYIEEVYKDLDDFFLHAKVAAVAALVDGQGSLTTSYAGLRDLLEGWVKSMDQIVLGQLGEVYSLTSREEAATDVLHRTLQVPIAVFGFIEWAFQLIDQQKRLEEEAYGQGEQTEEGTEGHDGGDGPSGGGDTGSAGVGDPEAHEAGSGVEGPPEV